MGGRKFRHFKNPVPYKKWDNHWLFYQQRPPWGIPIIVVPMYLHQAICRRLHKGTWTPNKINYTMAERIQQAQS